MTTKKVCKQFYIRKELDIELRRIAAERGISQSELIRQAIDHEISRAASQPGNENSAMAELTAFVKARRETRGSGKPYRWNREEIYAERENRWLRKPEND